MYNNKIIALFFLAPFFMSACSQIGLSDQQSKEPAPAPNGAECGGSVRTVPVEGYRANGLATVYTSSRQSASCQSVDLAAYTAAHANLPLNTNIKVTNKNTGKSVIIKINDRVSSSGVLITVTPAVARMLGGGSSFPVQIETITKMGSQGTLSRLSSSGGVPLKVKKIARSSNTDRYYIVVGTYRSQDEAFDRFIRLSSIGLSNTAMETRKIKGQNFHMVRIGPFFEQDKIDKTKDRLRNDGLVKFKVVKN